MRQITKDATEAFTTPATEFRRDNTTVHYNEHTDTSLLRLHGNLIATLNHKTNILMITNAGWTTNTTKERLNGITDYYNLPRVFARRRVWYFRTPLHRTSMEKCTEYTFDLNQPEPQPVKVQ